MFEIKNIILFKGSKIELFNFFYSIWINGRTR
jgi:hypothetical protein